MLQEEKNVTKIPPWTGKKKRTNESAIVERATPDYTPIHSVRTNAKVLYYEFKLYGGGSNYWQLSSMEIAWSAEEWRRSATPAEEWRQTVVKLFKCSVEHAIRLEGVQ